MTNRWDIINYLIERNNYKTYLECGYYKGWSFDNVKCDTKIAIDPNPSKDTLQEKAEYGSLIVKDDELIYKMTSDEFFKNNAFLPIDIFFIDGLHEAKQVSRDIENCLKFLSPGGIILLHDCNPIKYEHTTTGIDGCWTGDTYKAFIDFKHSQYPEDFITCVIDTDWGIGIIKPVDDYSFWSNYKELGINFDNGWDHFDKNRKDLLNLITVEEFKSLF